MYEVCTITEKRIENNSISTLFFDKSMNPLPGQFAMVWLPHLNTERPYSFSYKNAITVKVVGKFSKALFELNQGDRLWIRGPYGRGFPIKSGYVLIGGGVGIAPLRMIIEYVKNIKFLFGGKDKDEILFYDEFSKIGEIFATTEDGSMGKKGIVTDLLPVEGDYVAVCGPEEMMSKCLSLLIQKEKNIYLSLERFMKCGIGLCGHCTCSGRRVCIDGPVFSKREIKDMPDFGRRLRIKSGKWKLFDNIDNT